MLLTMLCYVILCYIAIMSLNFPMFFLLYIYFYASHTFWFVSLIIIHLKQTPTPHPLTHSPFFTFKANNNQKHSCVCVWIYDAGLLLFNKISNRRRGGKTKWGGWWYVFWVKIKLTFYLNYSITPFLSLNFYFKHLFWAFPWLLLFFAMLFLCLCLPLVYCPSPYL